jgi:hypothetical protein
MQLKNLPISPAHAEQMYQLWYASFGARSMKVKALLRDSPETLLGLFARIGPHPADGHRVSPRHLGIALVKFTRAGPVAGWQMRARHVSGQFAFWLVEAFDDTTSLIAHAGTQPAFNPEQHPQAALKEALAHGRAAMLEAMYSGDVKRLHAAQAFLKEIEESAKGFLRSYETQARVGQAWKG